MKKPIKHFILCLFGWHKWKFHSQSYAYKTQYAYLECRRCGRFEILTSPVE